MVNYGVMAIDSLSSHSNNLMLQLHGGAGFVEVTAGYAVTADAEMSYGAAAADFNGDGMVMRIVVF
eukprot:COSAG04_NODE_741_length_10670_cov_20.643837_1_plen_66_part_00